MKFKTSLLLAALAFLPGLAAAQQFPPTESGPMAGPDAGQSRPMMMDQRHPEGMGQEKPPMPHGGPLEAMPGALPEPIWLHGIKLSEDQEEQLFKILYAQLPTLHEQTKNLRHAHEALRTAPFSDKYDAAKVKNLSDAISHAIATLELNRATTDSRIYALLTAEQRQQVQEHINHLNDMAMGPAEHGTEHHEPGKPEARPEGHDTPMRH